MRVLLLIILGVFVYIIWNMGSSFSELKDKYLTVLVEKRELLQQQIEDKDKIIEILNKEKEIYYRFIEYARYYNDSTVGGRPILKMKL